MGENLAGGFVGHNAGTLIANYVAGAVIGHRKGGFTGIDSGMVTDGYWDTDVSGLDRSADYGPDTGAIGKTIIALQTPTTYTGIYASWNVDVDGSTATGVGGRDDPWDFGDSTQYPVLQYGGLDVDLQRRLLPLTARLRVASVPARGDTYRAGETIRMRAAYGRDDVRVPADAVLRVVIGGRTVSATVVAVAGSTSATDFVYVVSEADEDVDGISVSSSSLLGSFYATGRGSTSGVSHGVLSAQSGHKVHGGDWVPTFGEETLSAQSYVVGERVTLTLPAATSGDGVLTYALSPAPPGGLRLSTSSRVLTGVPLDVTLTTTYTWTATDTDGDKAELSFTIAVRSGVCDRTPQVRDEIMEQAGVSDCALVTMEHLSSITTLNLMSQNISALKAGDFDDLVNLSYLGLMKNQLEVLPAGLFSELRSLGDAASVLEPIDESFDGDVRRFEQSGGAESGRDSFVEHSRGNVFRSE